MVAAFRRLALVVHLLTPEQRHQRVQVITHVAGGAVEAEPVHVLDDDLMGQPDAQGEAPTGGGLCR